MLKKRLIQTVVGVAAATLGALFGALPNAAHAQSGDFGLRDGDRVVFYGDSITDQRMYTILTEDYILTRFPRRKITFIHSGWGGDRVTGGGGGSIDTRLNRDVTPYKPTVVTVMLGMNDGSYRAYDNAIFQTYAKGYQHLVDKIKQDNPGVRLTLIQASPFDDVTRAPSWDPGYNSVLLQYSAYVAKLAASEGAGVADLNTPVVAMLQKAKTANPDLAQKILPDRVHPAWGGHLIMAQGLLKAWNAPSLVSATRLDFGTAKGSGDQVKVTYTMKGTDGSLTWTSTEESLPFPLALPYNNNDPEYKLALESSDFVDALDREMLTVSGLPAPSYTLKIDGQEVGTFSSQDLAQGVNLATYPTPMLKQAQAVDTLTHRHSDTHNTRWRQFQVPLENDKEAQSGLKKAMDGLDALEADIVREQRDAAQPHAHTFVLAPKP